MGPLRFRIDCKKNRKTFVPDPFVQKTSLHSQKAAVKFQEIPTFFRKI